MGKDEFKDVFIAFGSNQGDWDSISTRTFKLIEKYVGAISLQSKTYITPAWGKTDQPDFKNGVILVKSILDPISCLNTLKKIEGEVGRQKTTKWGPRIIDLDIIDFNGETFETPILTIPHPYAHERQFVLEPFAEIAPNKILPNQVKTVSNLLKDLEDKANLKTL